MRGFALVLPAVFLYGAAAAALQKPTEDPLASDPNLPNYARFSSDVAMAGQPSEEGFQALKRVGFQSVLNLRTEQEGSLAERQTIEKMGIQYHNIPITTGTITPEKVDAFSKIVAEAPKPLLIHCASSNRVGALWYIHRMLRDGLEAKDALAEARKFGLTSPRLEEAAVRFVEEEAKAKR